MNEQEALKPLPHPVYFLCKNTKAWDKLMNSTSLPRAEEVYDKLLDLTDCWCVLTYIHLKQRGLNVHLVPHYIPGHICITSYDDLMTRDLPFRSYVVTCRCDRSRPEICEQRIVQNQLNIIDDTDYFIPHWPQPNLQPREQFRGTKIENLVFKGFTRNLAESFKSSDFLTQLQSLDVRLLVSSADLHARQCDDWIDYTQADVVLAVRDCTEYNLSFKPSSKLINAWFAGCPAFLGPEPAFQMLRKSELDYIEVRQPDDVISAVRRLQNEPALYSAMVDNGFQRARDFTPDRIALLWRELLAGPIADGYERWLRQSPTQKLIGRPVQFAERWIKHKQEQRHYWTNIHTGFRPIPS
jgi:hypothetical protein